MSLPSPKIIRSCLRLYGSWVARCSSSFSQLHRKLDEALIAAKRTIVRRAPGSGFGELPPQPSLKAFQPLTAAYP